MKSLIRGGSRPDPKAQPASLQPQTLILLYPTLTLIPKPPNTPAAATHLSTRPSDSTQHHHSTLARTRARRNRTCHAPSLTVGTHPLPTNLSPPEPVKHA